MNEISRDANKDVSCYYTFASNAVIVPWIMAATSSRVWVEYLISPTFSSFLLKAGLAFVSESRSTPPVVTCKDFHIYVDQEGSFLSYKNKHINLQNRWLWLSIPNPNREKMKKDERWRHIPWNTKPLMSFSITRYYR